MLAATNRLFNQFARHRGAANQFDQDINIGVARHVKNIAADTHVAGSAVGVITPGANMNDLNRRQCTPGDHIGVLS